MTDTPNSETVTVPASETATAPVASAKWQDSIGTFAKAIGKPYEDVSNQLAKLCGTTDDEGLAAIADPDCASNDDLRKLFTDVPPAKLNKAIKVLRTANAPATTPIAAPDARKAAPMSTALMALPEPPSDDNFLEALRVGGVAKVSATDVNAALRVMLAKQLGVYDLPERLVVMMEKHSDKLCEPAGEDFYALQKQVAEKRYGEVLEALGIHGRFMSESRKAKLLGRMDGVWNLLRGFQQRLDAWQKQWQDRMANPGAIMASFSAMLGGGAMVGMPGLMDHPEVAPVLDAASGVIDAFNKMFAGVGIPVARAMAQDSMRIKQTLENPMLPAAVGCSTRDEMLKMLSAAVSADYVRLEKDLVTYVLGVMKLAAGEVATEQQPYFLVALQNRGANIPWDKLLQLEPASKGRKDDDRNFSNF